MLLVRAFAAPTATVASLEPVDSMGIGQSLRHAVLGLVSCRFFLLADRIGQGIGHLSGNARQVLPGGSSRTVANYK